MFPDSHRHTCRFRSIPGNRDRRTTKTGIATSSAARASRVNVHGLRSAQSEVDVAVHVRTNESPSRRGCDNAELEGTFTGVFVGRVTIFRVVSSMDNLTGHLNLPRMR